MAILPSFSIKDVVELAKKGSTIEAQEKIIELRQAALDLQEENARLREKLSEAESKLDLQARLTFDGRAYWLNFDTPQTTGPFCQRCYDVEGKMVRLHDQEAYAGSRVWHCHGCKEQYFRQDG